MQYILGQNNKTGRYGFFKVSFFILAIFILANQIYQSPIANSASVSTNLLCASQRDLQIGMIGDDVKQLQQYLNQTDFPVALSGVGSAGRETNFFGPLTQSALSKFQQSQGVKSNLGFLDKNNNYFSCLEGDKNGNKIFQFERDLQIGMIGDDVKQLQQYLNQTDFPVALSGVGSAGRETNFFGPLTQSALIKFQNNHLINILDQPKLTRELGSLLLDTRNFINNKFDQELAPEQSSGDYSIGGTITGLAGEVILKNNDSDILSLNVGDNSNFVFAKKLFDQAPYNVTIESKYSPQFCYLHNNIGTINNGNVTNIAVACGINLYYNPFVYRPARSSSPTYTLQYTAGANGSISGESSQLVNRGASGSAVTALANTGYSFTNWSDALVDNPRTDTNVLSNISVTANFGINSYTITFDKNTGDTEADPTTRTTNYNTTVTLPVAPTKVGHTFDSWNTQADGNGSTFDNSTAVVANTTVYAKWIVNTYTVTFDKNTGDTEADPTTRTTNYNTTVTLPVAPTKVGHTFDSWNTQADGNGNTFDATTAVTANITVYAKWIVNTYTVTFDKNTGDTEADPTTRTTNYNTTITLPVAPTKVGHTFDSWNTQADGNGSTFDNSTAVVANTTVYAKWTALACGTYSVELDAITYGTVATADGECWLDRNLGASRMANTATDSDAFGYLYQWGRSQDGHQLTNSGTTATLSVSDTPGHSSFINSTLAPYDWRSPQNDNLWQGLGGTNNVCPTGFRVPTRAEWTVVLAAESITSIATAYSSALKLTVNGYRDRANASVHDQGTAGNYWSSTLSGADAGLLYFDAGGVAASSSAGSRAYGLGVRCIKD